MAQPRPQSKKRPQKKIPVNRGILILLGICLVLYLLMALEGELPDLSDPSGTVQAGGDGIASDCQVHFIDVGQGDSILIRSDGYTALIDAGENDQGKTVMDYLKAQGISRIDYLLMTHPHSDHIGGMDIVIKNFDIGTVIMPKLMDEIVPTTRTYTEVLEALLDKDLKITASKVGASYELGQGVLTILGPARDYDDLNNTSLVCRFEYQGKRFLFTGDMESPVESDMLEDGVDLRADVLKLGHHGSSSSTSKRFYRAVDPDYCIVLCGDGNSYGHPHRETIATIGESDAEIYRTDYQGDILFEVVDGEFAISYEKQKENAA